MKSIITNEKSIDEVLTRGVENIYPSREELKKVLMSGKRIKLYCGYDPTARSLHIGNAISINKLGYFQRLGHEVIFLVGDFTGMIGDPTDKSVTRKKLTRKEALENSKNYQKQASGYLKFDGKNPAKVLHNSEWSDKLTFKDVIELASNFTVQQMLTRTMFRNRLLGGKFNTYVVCRNCKNPFPSPIQFGDKKSFKTSTIENNTTICPTCNRKTIFGKKDLLQSEPIYLHEFLYPLAQGYDSVAMDVDLEIGGNDQTFNMLCGRDLMKAMKGKEKFVMTTKLLADETGKKMGKSEGNVVNLDESPKNMFGQIMAWSDGLIGSAFELCTNIPADQLIGIQKALKDLKTNPRDLKLKLAFEITKINHGEDAARTAKDYFIETFSKQEIPNDVSVSTSSAPEILLVDYIVEAGKAKSKSDARRKIEQGGVDLDGKKIDDWKMMLSSELHNGMTLKVGKFGFVKIKF